MVNAVNDVATSHKSYQVAASGSAYADMRGAGFPATLTLVPGVGGSMSASYSTTPNAIASPATATWIPWPLGSVSAPASDAILSPVVALMFSATGADGVAEVAS